MNYFLRAGKPEYFSHSRLRDFYLGQSKVFQEIDRRYRKPILRFVSQRVHKEEVASEIVQEIFLKIYRFRGQYDPAQAFSTWLWAVAKNTVTDSLRKERWDHDGRSDDEIVCPLPNAELLLENKSERRRFLKVFRKLTAPQRRVLWMRVVRQLSYEEIARNLGLSLSAVKCLAYRSRLILERMAAAPAF